MSGLASTLDLSRLLLLQSALSTITATSSRSPSYNLPISLFGLFVVDKSSTEGLRQFGALQALSFVMDVLWLLSGTRETGIVMTFLYLVNMAAKPVTLLAVASNLKEQGLPNVGPLNVGGGFGNGSANPRGTTVWSADEGNAYQTGNSSYHATEVDDDDDEPQQAVRTSAPAKKDECAGGYHTLA